MEGVVPTSAPELEHVVHGPVGRSQQGGGERRFLGVVRDRRDQRPPVGQFGVEAVGGRVSRFGDAEHRGEGVDLSGEGVRGRGVVYDVIGERPPFRVGELIRHAGPGIAFGQTSMRHQPLHPHGFVGHDHDDGVVPAAGPTPELRVLGQDGHVQDDDRTVGDLVDLGCHDSVRGGMAQRGERGERSRVGEDDAGQRSPVEAAVDDDAVAERLE